MRYLTVFITILGLDLGIKKHIEDHLEEKEQRSKCGGFLLIQKYHNKGAFLNAGQKMPWLVAVLSVALTLLLTILFAVSLTKAGSSTLKWGLTMLLGGAYSNTYDRLRRKYVVDYVSLQVPVKKLRQVVFNIGDFCIMAGAALVVIASGKNYT